MGTIRDAKTGKVLAGIRVQGWRLLDSSYLTLASLVAETDANGRYELQGMPRAQATSCGISSKSDRPYLVREVRGRGRARRAQSGDR